MSFPFVVLTLMLLGGLLYATKDGPLPTNRVVSVIFFIFAGLLLLNVAYLYAFGGRFSSWLSEPFFSWDRPARLFRRHDYALGEVILFFFALLVGLMTAPKTSFKDPLGLRGKRP